MSPRLVAFVITSTGILVSMGGREFTVARDHANFSRIKDALAAKQYDELPDLLDTRSAVRKFLSNGTDLVLKNDQIHLNDEPFSRAVTDKVLAMIEAGNPSEPLFMFLRKLRLNPSKTAQEELLLFCVANNFMIHEDGDILAYKSVRHDYTDIYSGKIKNIVGTINEMARSAVDDNRDRTCSYGFHFAAHQYASSWHGRGNARMLVVKVNPSDVVSIPSDYGNQKARTCRYTVYSEIAHGSRFAAKEVYSATDFDPNVAEREQVTKQLEAAAKVSAELIERRTALDVRIAALKEAAGTVPDFLLQELDKLLTSTRENVEAVNKLNAELVRLAPVVPATT